MIQSEVNFTLNFKNEETSELSLDDVHGKVNIFCHLKILWHFVIPFTFQTVDDFERRLKGLLRPKYSGVVNGIMPEGYLEAPLAYDAIWAVALGKLNIDF